MRIIVRRIPLLEALRASRAVIKAGTPKPVLKCVHLATGDAFLTLRATDLELSFRRHLREVQIERAGTVCVGWEDLLAVVGAATDETLAFEVEKESLVIKGASGRFSLFTVPPGDFPPAPESDSTGEAITLPADSLRKLIGQTSFAAADVETRFGKKGSMLTMRNKRAVMATTDGRHLAVGEVDASGASPKEGWLLPPRLVASIGDSFGGDEITVRAGTESAIDVSDGDTLVRAPMMEKGFVPWEDVIPKDSLFKFSASRAALAEAVQQAAIFTANAGGARGAGTIRVVLGKGGVLLVAQSSQFGESRVEFPCKVEGGEMEIGIGADHLRPALRAAESDEVSLLFNAPNRAMLIVGGSFRCAIMPRILQ